MRNRRKSATPDICYTDDPLPRGSPLNEHGIGDAFLQKLQPFIVSNRDQTFYFANNNARHFAFNADERCVLSHCRLN